MAGALEGLVAESAAGREARASGARGAAAVLQGSDGAAWREAGAYPVRDVDEPVELLERAAALQEEGHAANAEGDFVKARRRFATAYAILGKPVDDHIQISRQPRALPAQRRIAEYRGMALQVDAISAANMALKMEEPNPY